MSGLRERVVLDPTYRLQWEEPRQCYVLLFPEGLITLDRHASAILKHCDGTRTVGDIITALKQQSTDCDLETDVPRFLAMARDRGWIRYG
ncbi:MAG: pyrroloquinoline quinone biosynthesis peptide chaperone PqqD [Gammaproteobacteria bacterium]